MSGAPFGQWAYISDSRYPHAKGYTFEWERQSQGQMAVSNPPFPAGEPPRYMLPITQSHEQTGTQSANQPRVSGYSRAWDSSSDFKYRPTPTTTGSLAQYSLHRSSLSRNPEHAGYSTSYHDASVYSRGSVSSVGRFNDVDSQYSSSSATLPSPVHSSRSSVSHSTIPHPSSYHQQLPIHHRHATASMPSGFENLLHHHHATPSPPSPSRRSSRTSSRYRLAIRQQPLAARACGAGDRDRRAVDPPPVIQILLTDFNSRSEEDRAILQDPRFTVGCLLYPVQDTSRRAGPGTLDSRAISTNRKGSRNADLGLDLDDGNVPGQCTPLLSGKAFVSPFYVDEDPDPNTAPQHPSSTDNENDGIRQNTKSLARKHTMPRCQPPASFFIFSDLSVRQAGLYRLQFRLMNWGSVEDTGRSMPILAEAWSDPFRVYPAKDFPGMRDSSLLTLRLKELGFVELKTRGKGMGKGRRVAGSKGNVE